LAEHVAGSQSAFVEMMNQKAQELGCQNTHFVNAHGLHNDEHYTTARDLMKIASYAMKNETFARIVKIDRTVLPATNKRGEQTISSTNHLISRWRRTDYFYEGAIGIKTGSTTPAGLCLVSGVNVDDLTYITVVLGASQGDDGAMGSFTETIKLLDYAKTGFALQNIASSSDPVTEAPVGLGKDVDSVILNPAEDVSALLPVGFDKSLIKIESEVQPDIKAPVEKGQTLGSATFSYDGKEYAKVNLVAADSVRRSTWLFIMDKVLGLFSSVIFRIVVGLLVLAVLAILIYGSMNRRRRHRRKTRRVRNYKGRRR